MYRGGEPAHAVLSVLPAKTDISVSESSLLQSLYLLPVWCDGLTVRLQALDELGRMLQQLRLGRCQFQGVIATCRSIVLFFPVACGFGVVWLLTRACFVFQEVYLLI